MKVNDLLNVAITDVMLDGRAVARHDDRVVFVDRGLPGDRLLARVVRVRRSHVEARAHELLERSAERVPPTCPHVEQCGGCRFQELDYAAQCRLKLRHVREMLRRIGGVQEPPVADVRPSPDRFGYRNKMEFSFHPGNDGPVLGLHVRGQFDRVFPVTACFLPSGLTMAIVATTQRFAAERRWRAYHPREHQGVVRFLTVRHVPHTDQCAVHLVAAADQIPGVEEWAAEVAALSPAVRTVTLLINGSRANVAFGDSERALVGDGRITERLLGIDFEVTANVFLQTNSRQAEALYRAVLDAAALGPEDVVLDLYSGCGTLTLLCARAAREAVGVESVTDSVERARGNAARNGIGNARFVAGEARRVLREWARGERPDPPRPRVVVVDPPRAGLHPRVVARICELRPRRVVYVSCNPATLARDLKDFATGGYALTSLEPFDMFPHTPHVECVARLDAGARLGAAPLPQPDIAPDGV